MELGVLRKPKPCRAEGRWNQLINAAEHARELADEQMRSERMRPHCTAKVWRGWDPLRACEEEPI